MKGISKDILKGITIAIVTSLVLTVLVGCRDVSNGGKVITDDSTLKVGVLVYRYDDQFIQSMMVAMEAEVKRIQEVSDVGIVFDFVDGKNQQDIQMDQLQQFIEEDYDALAVNLVDRSAASKVIAVTKEANIPVVFYNRQPVQEDMARWNRIYYVGTDGEQAGVIQGEIIADYIKGHAEVDKNGDGVIQYVMLQGQVGHQDAILRSKTSVATARDKGIELEELAKDTANWQRAEAKDKMKNWLGIFPDEIEFIISNNDAMAIGAIDAMKELEIPIIPIVGVDAIDLAVDALENKEMVGTVLNDGEQQGQGIIQIAYYLARDEDPVEFIEDIDVGKYLWVPYQRISN